MVSDVVPRRQIQHDVAALYVVVAHTHGAAVEIAILEQVEDRIGEHYVDKETVDFGPLAVGRQVVIHGVQIFRHVRRGIGGRRLKLVAHRGSRGALLGTGWTAKGRRGGLDGGHSLRHPHYTTHILHRRQIGIMAEVQKHTKYR